MEERMTKMEAEYGHLREGLLDATKELKATNALLRQVPGLIGRRVRRHEKKCPGNPANPPPAGTPRQQTPMGDQDWGWARKVIPGMVILGALAFGAYREWTSPGSVTQPAITAPADQSRGGNP